jgi:hypothetical protein
MHRAAQAAAGTSSEQTVISIKISRLLLASADTSIESTTSFHTEMFTDKG